MPSVFFNIARNDLREAFDYICGTSEEERSEILNEAEFYNIITNDLLQKGAQSVSLEYISTNDFLFNHPGVIRITAKAFPDTYKILLELGPENTRIVIDEEALIDYALSHGVIWHDTDVMNVTDQLSQFFNASEFWYRLLKKSADAEYGGDKFIRIFDRHISSGLKANPSFIRDMYQLNPSLIEGLINTSAHFKESKNNLLLIASAATDTVKEEVRYTINPDQRIIRILKFRLARDFVSFPTPVKNLILKIAGIQHPDHFNPSIAQFVLNKCLDVPGDLIESERGTQLFSVYIGSIRQRYHELSVFFNDTELDFIQDLEFAIWFSGKSHEAVMPAYFRKGKLLIFRLVSDLVRGRKLLGIPDQNTVFGETYFTDISEPHTEIYSEERKRQLRKIFPDFIRMKVSEILDYSSSHTQEYYKGLFEADVDLMSLINDRESVRFNQSFYNEIIRLQ